MKKTALIAMILCFVVGSLFANGTQEAGDDTWSMTKNAEWVVTSSAGGGSSIFTQNIVEIIKAEGLADKDIIINYQTDGGGAVGRRRVSGTNSNGHTLLTFNSGDLQPLVTVEGGDLDDVTALAVMALDGQILLVRDDYKYQTIEEIIAALDAGERLIIGGSKADDEAIYKALGTEIGGDMEYIRSDSTGEVLTQLLGGHVDVGIAKPAASFDLVNSGELKCVAACGASEYDGAFAAPTLLSLGYDIKFEIYRGVVGPKNMPQGAVDFWVDVLKKVSQTEAWKNDYINKFLLNANPKFGAEATAYMQGFEDQFLK